jgi:hypothetical protein
MLDIIGQILWFTMLASPGVAIIWWRRKKDRTKTDLFIALAWAFCVACFCFFTSLAILFRNGLGPG